MKKGLFITFEGTDGCGKSTQSILLLKHLSSQGFKVVHTREPGGTSLAEFLRGVLLHGPDNIAPLTELLLYSAARAQHTIEKIKPAVAEGKIVICERFTDATVAYQGYGRNLNLEVIRRLNAIATEGFKPDITVVLDLPVSLGLKRMSKREKDRLERENRRFHERVRKGYLRIARAEPKRVKVLGAAGSIKEVHSAILKVIKNVCKI